MIGKLGSEGAADKALTLDIEAGEELTAGGVPSPPQASKKANNRPSHR